MGYDTWISGLFTIEPPLETIEDFDDDKYYPWIVSEDCIEGPDQDTRATDYGEVLVALVKDLAARGHTVNGKARWDGEESDDFGEWSIENNVISVRVGYRALADPKIIYGGEVVALPDER